MKKTILAFSAMALLAACSPKTTEAVVESVNTSEAVIPDAMASEGKMIYEAKCQKCHKLKVVDSFSAEKWAKILPVMAGKAKLEGNQEDLVSQYINWELTH